MSWQVSTVEDYFADPENAYGNIHFSVTFNFDGSIGMGYRVTRTKALRGGVAPPIVGMSNGCTTRYAEGPTTRLTSVKALRALSGLDVVYVINPDGKESNGWAMDY